MVGFTSENRAMRYFRFPEDLHLIELEASRDIPWDDADVLSEYDMIEDEEIVYETFRPEELLSALKKTVKLLEEGWVDVELKISFKDKESSSQAIVVIGRSSYDNPEKIFIDVTADLKR